MIDKKKRLSSQWIFKPVTTGDKFSKFSEKTKKADDLRFSGTFGFSKKLFKDTKQNFNNEYFLDKAKKTYSISKNQVSTLVS